MTSPVAAAARNGHVKCIQLLIDKGANVHLADFGTIF